MAYVVFTVTISQSKV